MYSGGTLEALKALLGASSGLLTPLIAVIAVYIAWQQWRTARQKLRMDLFDKRYASFERILSATNTASAKIMECHDTLEASSSLIECWRASREAHLLFGDPTVDDLIRRLNGELSKLAIAIGELRTAHKSNARSSARPLDHSNNISRLQDELFGAVETRLLMGKIK
jgi:hypothetical protein